MVLPQADGEDSLLHRRFQRRPEQYQQRWTWWWLTHNPSVQMVFGHSLHILGLNAYNVLGQVASQCTITEFVWPFPWSAPLRERYPWPPEEFVLGGILQQYHEAFEFAEAGQEAPGRDELIIRGLRAATEAHMTELRATIPSRAHSTCRNAWRRGSGSLPKQARATSRWLPGERKRSWLDGCGKREGRLGGGVSSRGMRRRISTFQPMDEERQAAVAAFCLYHSPRPAAV